MHRTRLMSALLIFILVMLWGISFSIYKAALIDCPPILFAGIRTFLGGVVVLVIAIVQQRKFRVKGQLHIYLISAVFNVVLFFGLQTVGLNYLPAGLFSVLIYLEPVLVGLLASIWLGEEMSWRKIIGLISGFLGVAAISASSFTSHLSVAGICIGILTAIFWAIGTVYSKRVQQHIDMMWLLAVQFLIGGLFITGVGSVAETWSAVTWSPVLIWSTLFGGFFGIGLSWIIWFFLVKSGDASRIAAFTFFVPLISVATSVIFLHETISAWLIVGLVLIVAGIYLANRKSRQNRPSLTEMEAQYSK